MFAATLDIDREQMKISKGISDLKYIIIKVLEEKLHEREITDEEKCDAFKHV